MYTIIIIIIIIIIMIMKYNGRQVKLNTLGEVQYTEAKKCQNPPLTDTNTYHRSAALRYCTHGHRHIHED